MKSHISARARPGSPLGVNLALFTALTSVSLLSGLWLFATHGLVWGAVPLALVSVAGLVLAARQALARARARRRVQRALLAVGEQKRWRRALDEYARREMARTDQHRYERCLAAVGAKRHSQAWKQGTEDTVEGE